MPEPLWPDPFRVARNFGRAAEQYQQFAALQHEVLRQALALATPWLGAAKHVLDAGSGPGTLNALMARRGMPWQITPLDIAMPMLRAARGARPSLMPWAVNGMAELLPFRPSSFDTVISSLMGQWLPQPETFFAESLRVLQPGGTLLFTSFTEGTLREFGEAFRRVDRTPHILPFRSPHQFRDMARLAGFQVQDWQIWHHRQQVPDVYSLMRQLKSIGATNAFADQKRGLTTPSFFDAVEEAYRALHATAEGMLPVTWSALTLLLRKP